MVQKRYNSDFKVVGVNIAKSMYEGIKNLTELGYFASISEGVRYFLKLGMDTFNYKQMEDKLSKAKKKIKELEEILANNLH